MGAPCVSVAGSWHPALPLASGTPFPVGKFTLQMTVHISIWFSSEPADFLHHRSKSSPAMYRRDSTQIHMARTEKVFQGYFLIYKKEGTITVYAWYNKHPSSYNPEVNLNFSPSCVEKNVMNIHFAISSMQKNSFPALFVSLTTRKLCTVAAEVLHTQHTHSLQHENYTTFPNSITGCLQRQAD